MPCFYPASPIFLHPASRPTSPSLFLALPIARQRTHCPVSEELYQPSSIGLGRLLHLAAGRTLRRHCTGTVQALRRDTTRPLSPSDWLEGGLTLFGKDIGKHSLFGVADVGR